MSDKTIKIYYGLSPNIETKELDGCGMDARYKIPISVDLEVFVGSLFFFKQRDKYFLVVYGYIVDSIGKFMYGSYPNTEQKVDTNKLFKDNYKIILSAILKSVLNSDDILVDSISIASSDDINLESNEHRLGSNNHHYFQVSDSKVYNKLKKIAKDTLIPYHTYTIRYVANKNIMDIRRSIGAIYKHKDQSLGGFHIHVPYAISNERIKGFLDIEYTTYIQANISTKELEVELKKAIDVIKDDIKNKLEYYTTLDKNLKKDFPISVLITNDRYRTEKEDRYE